MKLIFLLALVLTASCSLIKKTPVKPVKPEPHVITDVAELKLSLSTQAINKVIIELFGK